MVSTRGTYGRTVWNRYNRMLGKPGLGSEQWDTDSGTTHAVEAGVTLCGVQVGGIRLGWELNTWARTATEEFVECLRCRRSLERERTRSEASR